MAKKKRYYQSRKDRMDESRGMARKFRKMEEYAGEGQRNRMEYEDSKMIHEDHSQVANLPQQVMMKAWPDSVYARYNLNDTISGIDVQMYDDSEMKKSNGYKRGKFPEKY